MPKLPPIQTPEILPRPELHFTGEVGRTYLDSDPPQFPQPTAAPKGAPNIVLILLDDVGFGQFSTFGGGVPSPTMDRLAKDRFHTTALRATGYDGYCCVLPRNCGTVGEVLRQNGYMTAWIGKNHNTPTWETSAAGPFDRWANGLGFDYFYGFNAGDMNHGAKVAETQLERSVPIQFAIFEGLDIGMDTGSAVDFTCKLPFAFTGRIKQVAVEVFPEAAGKAAKTDAKADMSRQ